MSCVGITWRALAFLGSGWQSITLTWTFLVWVIGEVEKELLANRPSEATAENVTEEATDFVEIMEEAAITTHVDPVPDKQ